MTAPSTEYQSLSDRVHLLEEQTMQQFHVLSAQNAVILAEAKKIATATRDMVDAWDGAKSVVTFAKYSGKVTIAFAALLLALTAIWSTITGVFK